MCYKPMYSMTLRFRSVSDFHIFFHRLS
jgi:hypothetical protein